MSILREAVMQTESELEYYKRTVEEQREIIEQLTGTGKPKGYVYMHPYDLAELLNNTDASKVLTYIDIYKTEQSNEVEINGRLIRQSAHIPAVSKNFK